MSVFRAFALAVSLALAIPPAFAQTNPPPLAPLVKPPPGAKPRKPPPPHHKPAAKPRTPTAKDVKPAAPPPAPATAAPAPAKPPPPKLDPTKGSTTGLKLPRWVSFRSDDVNLRTGPGMQYPIDWQYHRRDLPVSVLREYEVWRLVQTQDGAKGWVHQATLTGRRGFLIVDPEHVLRAAPDDTSAAVARLEAGVVGHVRSCAAGQAWCEVQTGAYRGFLRRTDMWGVDPDEAIN